MKYTVGVDLGGTKVLAAIVNEHQEVVTTTKLKTAFDEGPQAVARQMAHGVRKAVADATLDFSDIVAIGAAAPGPTDRATGIVANAPNLGWHDPVPLGAMLTELLDGLPVIIENDVNAGTYGEWALGAGRGAQDVVGIFIGTGIGGGLILDGKLRSGARSAAGEIGHIIMLPDGPVCGCGNRGCVEALSSRKAIEREIAHAIQSGRPSKVTDLMGKKNKTRLTSGILADAWASGDPVVTEVLQRAARYWGLLTANIVNLIDPQRIIFGGGVMEKLGDTLLSQVRPVAYQHFIKKSDADQVAIVPAALGDNAGVLGAALLAHLAPPN
jgi:glucokinase